MILHPIPAADFIARVRTNPINATLLDRLPALGLPDCWLVAGCLFQTIWNLQSGQPPATQFSDYDVFFCDPTDLSYEAEDAAIQRLKSAVADLDAVVELKNQARVHLWYRQRFGHDYPALQTSTDAIDRFLVAGTCVAISCTPDQPSRVYASHGLADLYAGILRPNPLNHPNSRYLEKSLNYQSRWPWLHIKER